MDPWLFRRISVRHLIDGDAFDVIGRVIARTDSEVTLMRRDGRVEVVHVAAIAAAREVPEDDGRHRAAHLVSIESLTAMLERVSGPLATGQRVLVADLPQAQGTHTPNDANIQTHVENAHLSALLTLCGDWLAIDSIRIAPSANRSSACRDLFDVASTWARARGAVHAWTITDESDNELATDLRALGFVEV